MVAHRCLRHISALFLLISTAALAAQPSSDRKQAPVSSQTHGPSVDVQAVAARIKARLLAANEVLPDGLDVLVTIDSTGTPVKVLDYRGYGLRNAIAAAVMEMKFSPALHDGRPVSVMQWLHLKPGAGEAGSTQGTSPVVTAMLYDEISDGRGHAAQIEDANVPNSDAMYDEAELQHRVVYPDQARSAKIEGTIFIRALVSPAGVIREMHIDGSEHIELEAAALYALVGLRFRPARQQGKAVSSWVEIPVAFKLH